jgi:hypothetical protein
LPVNHLQILIMDSRQLSLVTDNTTTYRREPGNNIRPCNFRIDKDLPNIRELVLRMQNTKQGYKMNYRLSEQDLTNRIANKYGELFRVKSAREFAEILGSISLYNSDSTLLDIYMIKGELPSTILNNKLLLDEDGYIDPFRILNRMESGNYFVTVNNDLYIPVLHNPLYPRINFIKINTETLEIYYIDFKKFIEDITFKSVPSNTRVYSVGIFDYVQNGKPNTDLSMPEKKQDKIIDFQSRLKES